MPAITPILMDRGYLRLLAGLQEGERASITPIADGKDSWISIRQAPVGR